MGRYMKGFGVTVESILMMGGIVAAALFFASFYNVAMHEAGAAYSASERAFVDELEKKIDMVYFSSGDYVEYGYEPSLKEYKLIASGGKLSIAMTGREPVYVISAREIADTKIENREAICIKRDVDVIRISGGKCGYACDTDDETCDEGCGRFNVDDPAC